MGTKVSPNSEQAQILRRTLAILYAEQLAACPNEYLVTILRSRQSLLE